MKRIFDGKVISNKMAQTVTVSITTRITHPLYKKLIKRDRKFKADVGSFSPKVGDMVKIAETRPMSKDKHFKVTEVKSGSA